MTARYDAAIIGGGVAGATAAILLAAAGWSVSLVERRQFPRRKVCGECIAAPNLPLLDALGVGSEFAAAAGPPLTRIGLCVGDDILSADLPRSHQPGAPWARALGRESLDTLLVARAMRLGVAIFQPCTVRNIERRGALYTCRLTSDRGETAEIEAPVLIAAHGSWEPEPWLDRSTRRACGSDLLAFKANFSGSGLAPGLLPLLAFRGGYGGMVIADRGMLTLACCVRRDALREWRVALPAATAGDAVQAGLEASCRGVRRALAGARREGAWLAAGPVRPGARAAWTERSGFAVGNAAGEAHPILGEGISMAIQSSWLLCERLARGRNPPLGAAHAAIAHAYARDWRRAFTARVRFSAALAHLAMRPGAARVLLPLLRSTPRVLTVAARLGSKVRPLRVAVDPATVAPQGMVPGTEPRLGGKHP